MLCFPNGKINIGLYITGRREDGYHNLETIFYPVPLKDALEAVPAKNETSLHLSGKTVSGSTGNNLVWKAYQLLQERYPDKVPDLDIYLHKVIPMGAGMGGGSADGAFMLKLLNDYADLQLSQEQLAAFALLLGSDCPFFIYNTPQFAQGRGEILEPVTIDLSGYTIQIICPEVHISTAKAFSMLSPRPATFYLKDIVSLPVSKWKEKISNDFEQPVFKEHPELERIKRQLYEQGAVYASMSGSGSAIYGIFPKGNKAAIHTTLAFEMHVI